MKFKHVVLKEKEEVEVDDSYEMVRATITEDGSYHLVLRGKDEEVVAKKKKKK